MARTLVSWGSTLLSSALVVSMTTALAPAATAETTAGLAPLDLSTIEWNYLDTDTDPSDGLPARTDWTAPDFDDSAWPTAEGSFGAVRGQLGSLSGGFTPDNLLNQYKAGSSDNIETFFFRGEFELSAADLAEADILTGEVRYDDAAIVYVNGERVGGFHDDGLGFSEEGERRNMVYGGSNASAPILGEFSVEADVLQEGTNTVAVQIHNGRASSSDVYFDMESLELTEAPPAAGPTDLILGIGGTPQDRTLAWFTDSGTDEVVQIAAGEHTALPAEARTVQPSDRGAAAVLGQDYVHAELTGLEPGQYTYRVGSEAGGWTEPSVFTVHPQDVDHEFTVVGDPQIGSSRDAERDGQGWAATLDAAERLTPEAEFILSMGDQVETYAGSQVEYMHLLQADQMRTVPSAMTVGNHDVSGGSPHALFHQHFNRPHETEMGNYWFVYNDVLHLNLNTEHRVWEDHRAWLEQVIAENGQDAAWTMLTFHRSLTSVGTTHSQSSTTRALREGLFPIIGDLPIDMVLQGHDHSYSRSYLMEGATPLHDLEEHTAEEGHEIVFPEEGQTLYLTANSSSGSKYYNMVTPELAPWAKVGQQEREPAFTNMKVTRCSVLSTTMNQAGVVQDQVELYKDREAPVLQVPGAATVTAGGEFDPLAGVTVSDNCVDLTVADVTVTGTVDLQTPGTYELTYTVADQRGQETSVSRTVEVTAAPEPVCDVADFSDNPEGSVFYTPVRWLQCEGLSTGYTDGTYRKNRDINRGETVALLHRYLADDQSAPGVSPFTDVATGHPYYAPITWAASEGVATGYTDDTFRPYRPVTRGEFASFLYRTAETDHTVPGSSEFGDVSTQSAHYEAITWLTARGITTGYTDGSFRPNRQVSRGEVAAFLHRYDGLDQAGLLSLTH